MTGVWHLGLDLDTVTGLWYNYDPNFGSLSSFWRCKEHFCPLSPDFRTFEDAEGSWLGFGILIFILMWPLVFETPIFWVLALYLDKEHPCSLSSDFGLWRILDAPGQRCISWSLFGYGHWSLIHQFLDFWLYILILRVPRKSMSFKSWFGALEVDGGFWLGFSILILI